MKNVNSVESLLFCLCLCILLESCAKCIYRQPIWKIDPSKICIHHTLTRKKHFTAVCNITLLLLLLLFVDNNHYSVLCSMKITFIEAKIYFHSWKRCVIHIHFNWHFLSSRKFQIKYQSDKQYPIHRQQHRFYISALDKILLPVVSSSSSSSSISLN